MWFTDIKESRIMNINQAINILKIHTFRINQGQLKSVKLYTISKETYILEVITQKDVTYVYVVRLEEYLEYRPKQTKLANTRYRLEVNYGRVLVKYQENNHGIVDLLAL
jgi:hypothetical protein